MSPQAPTFDAAKKLQETGLITHLPRYDIACPHLRRASYRRAGPAAQWSAVWSFATGAELSAQAEFLAHLNIMAIWEV